MADAAQRDDPASDHGTTGHGHLLAIVAGAGPGLGSAVAREFAGHGFRLALIARNPDQLDLSGMTPDQLDLSGMTPDGRSDLAPMAVPADLGDPIAVGRAFAAIRDTAGDASVLIFTASVFAAGTPTQVDYVSFVGALRDGVGGALLCVQEVAPAMRSARSGTILFAGSSVATRPWVEAAAVGVAKAGLRNLAFALASELEPDGVRVALVTIDGVIQNGGIFDPARIARSFWDVHETTLVDGSHGPAEIVFGRSTD
jgi:NAD(P)-dependent dehydrogenase (short-subunit alcohol dehydrogenase family)